MDTTNKKENTADKKNIKHKYKRKTSDQILKEYEEEKAKIKTNNKLTKVNKSPTKEQLLSSYYHPTSGSRFEIFNYMMDN